MRSSGIRAILYTTACLVVPITAQMQAQTAYADAVRGVVTIDRQSGQVVSGAIPTASPPPALVADDATPSIVEQRLAPAVIAGEEGTAVLVSPIETTPPTNETELATIAIEAQPVIPAQDLTVTDDAVLGSDETPINPGAQIADPTSSTVNDAVIIASPTEVDVTGFILDEAERAQVPQILAVAIDRATIDMSGRERDAVRAFYASRGNVPIFLSDPTGAATTASVLADAPRHGLPASRYSVPGLQNHTPSLSDKLDVEIAMAARFLRYSRDQEKGLVLPRSLNDEFDFEPGARNYADYFADYAARVDKQRYFDDLLPNDPAYGALVAELAKMRQMGASGVNAPKVPEGETLREESYGARVVALRNRLEAMGYPSVEGAVTGTVDNVADAILADVAGEAAPAPIAVPETPARDFNPAYFDGGLAAAVRNFQTDAGIDVDGVVGPSTLANINAGSEEKIQSLLVGLERQRWGSPDRNGRQIFVNIANFMAEVRDNDKKTFETRVVVGKNREGWRTPEFNDEMTHLIVNPKWYVPESISVREYLPKIQADPSYLERNNITMKIRATGQVVRPSQIDMNQFTVNDFPFLLVQGEGDDNALGDVKFMFPNTHNIYLHDTPSKNLFSRAIRAFSHGCVRVSEPVDLARTLLSPQASDPLGEYNALRATGTQQQVDLATPIPIHLTYFTAYMNDSGGVSYAPDSYGRDKLLRHALESMGVQFA